MTPSPSTPVPPAAAAAALAPLIAAAQELAGCGRRQVLGITGPPGAGKSTVASALTAALGGRAALVGMDGFHLSGQQLRRLGRADRKGAPDTFDVAGYRSLLARVRTADEAVYVPVFDRGIEESIAAAEVVLPGVPLIITEGNYLLLDDHGWGAIRPLLDVAWFLEVDPAERVRRLRERRRSHGHDADETAGWVRRVDEPNAAVVAATRGRADWVVRVAESPALS